MSDVKRAVTTRATGDAPQDDVDSVGLTDGLAKLIGKTLMVLPRVSPARWIQRRFRCTLDAGGAERFTVNSHDGVALDALRLRGVKGGERPAVVMSHGWMEIKECQLRQARMVSEAGHDVILFDHRAHGRSEGQYTTFGVHERHDARAVIDAAEQRAWLPHGVVTMGLSLGAATVIMEAADDPRVRGVIAIAPFTSFADAIDSYRRLYVPPASTPWAVRGFKRALRDAGVELLEADVLGHARRLNRPVLVAVGERDRNLPGAVHAKRIAEAIGEPWATWCDVPGADHFNVCRRRWPGFDEAVLAFLDRVSAGGHAG